MVSISFQDKGPAVQLLWIGKAVSINRRRKLMKRGNSYRIGNDPAYAAFIDDMSWTFKTQHQGPPIVGPVLVIISLTKGVRGGHTVDLDAYNKQIIDALEHSGVLENDNQVKYLFVHAAGTNPKEDIIMIQVMAVDDFAIDGKFANGE